MTTRVQRLRQPAAMLQLRIELAEVRPKVWRRVLVPETITLARLHAVIQAAFGWHDAHLHEFIGADGQRYGERDPMYDAPGEVASERTRLTTALAGGRALRYIYDFGDNWDHRIKLEKTREPDPLMKLPCCTDGAAATPPEDCGSVPGYQDFIAAMADPAHEDHADMVDWIGRDSWDPNAFDIAEANARLAYVKI